MNRQELAEALAEAQRREAMAWHLQYNFYPQSQLHLLEYALRAVDLVNAGFGDDEVTIVTEEGFDATLRYGETPVTAWELVSDLRLEDQIQEGV